MLPPRNDPQFPIALKAARIAMGLSKSEVARRAGIHVVMPARYENEVQPTIPEEKTWEALNKVLFPIESSTTKPNHDLTQVSLDELISELKRRGATSVSISW